MLYLLVVFRNKLLNLRNKSNIAFQDVVAEERMVIWIFYNTVWFSVY